MMPYATNVKLAERDPTFGAYPAVAATRAGADQPSTSRRSPAETPPSVGNPRDRRESRHRHEVGGGARASVGSAPPPAQLTVLPPPGLPGTNTGGRLAGCVADSSQLFDEPHGLKSTSAERKACTKVCTEVCTESADRNPLPPRNYWGFAPDPSQTTRPPRGIRRGWWRVVWLGSRICGGQAGRGRERGGIQIEMVWG